jgi:hypothetical protein
MFSSTDAQILMHSLKNRCAELKSAKKSADLLSLLTLAPVSWSLQQTATFFSVSVNEVRRSRILKEEKGVLSRPDPKISRKISDSEKDIIQNFYMDDDNSRLMPGRKDVKSVKTPGEKRVRLQKRLLLMNIDELYSHYKDYCVNTLMMNPCGRTKFFQLRPQHVIEVGSAGTHSVCVCEKHQNVKIMINCLCKNLVIAHSFMDKLVCDIENRVCMMSRCADCPLPSVLREHLRSFIDSRTTIKFQQWESTDRTKLAVAELPIDDFINKLSDMIS